MVSLTDIAPARTTVPVQGHTIEVNGITAKTIAALLERFPEVKLLMAGKQSTANLFELAPTAIAAIIAAGTGKPDDLDEEQAAARLPIEDQANLIEAISKLTFPSGFGPFVERIMALTAAVEGASGKGLVSNLRKPSNT